MPSKVTTYRPRMPDASGSRPPVRPRRGEGHAESKKFYNSQAWIRARYMHLAESPLCIQCKAAGRLVPATHVHHRVEVLDDPAKRLEDSNLVSLCNQCHSKLHAHEPVVSTSPP